MSRSLLLNFEILDMTRDSVISQKGEQVKKELRWDLETFQLNHLLIHLNLSSFDIQADIFFSTLKIDWKVWTEGCNFDRESMYI